MNIIKIKYMSLNKYNITLWLLISLILVATAACSRVSIFDEEETVVEFVDMNLNMNVINNSISQETLERDEKIINVDLYVFKKNTPGDYIFDKKYSVNEADIKVTESLEGRHYSFVAQLRATTKPVVMYLVANQPGREEHTLTTVDAEVPENNSSFMVTPEDLQATLVGTGGNPIPMTGKVMLPLGISTTTAVQNMTLLRSMARVDLMKKEGMSNDLFKLTGMSVWFTPDRARLFSTNIGALSVVTAPTMPETFAIIPEDPKAQTGATASPLKWNTTEAEGVTEIKNKIFLYENSNFHATPEAKEENRNSRLVVSGYYNKREVLSYYPVDFTDETDPHKYVDMLRNHKYLITINGVGSAGYTTERDAAYGDRMDISASVITWTDKKQEIIFDGLNWFSIDKKEILLGGIYGFKGLLGAGSSIEPSSWKMQWGEGPISDENTVTGTHFSVTKPEVKEGGFLTFNLIASTTKEEVETLTIHVNNRLNIEIVVTAIPDGYSIDEWINNPPIDPGV
jgi:hypothetical protein